jgi:hypothetical protein
MKTGLVIAASIIGTIAVLGAAKRFAPGLHSMVA